MNTGRQLRLRLAYALCALALALSAVYYGAYGRKGFSFHGDALGYYLYLPTTFIYHNFKSIDRLPEDRQIPASILNSAAAYSANQRSEKGYLIYQYTYGMALLELPFFAVAHAVELARGSPANGFSETYQNAISVSTVFYAFLGLWLTYHLLRRYYAKPLSLAVIALLLLGTNLFWFTWQQHGMAHVPLFFLMAALLHLTIRVHESWRWKQVLLLGFVGGLITLIRPVNGLVLLFPLLYGITERGVSGQLHLFWQQRVEMVAAGGLFLLPIVPQLLLWKWLTGHFHFDSYGDWQTLNLLHPRLISGLFKGNNGWLMYTPLMALSVAGLFLLRKKLRLFQVALPLFVGLYVWVIYSWYCYNYINGLGSRPMVDVYAALALPMAAFMNRVKRKGAQLLLALFIAAAVALNLNYTVQQVEDRLWSEYSSLDYNRATAFRSELCYNDLVVWDVGQASPDTSNARTVGEAFVPNLEDTTVKPRLTTVNQLAQVYPFRTGEEYANYKIKIKVRDLPAGTQLLQARVAAFLPAEENDIWKNAMLVVAINRNQESVLWQGVRLSNKIGTQNGAPLPGTPPLKIHRVRNNLWGTVAYFVALPANLQPNDEIVVDIWNKGKWEMLVANLQLVPFATGK